MGISEGELRFCMDVNLTVKLERGKVSRDGGG